MTRFNSNRGRHHQHGYKFTQADKTALKTALDLMGNALDVHTHVWTTEERAAYNTAIDLVSKITVGNGNQPPVVTPPTVPTDPTFIDELAEAISIKIVEVLTEAGVVDPNGA